MLKNILLYIWQLPQNVLGFIVCKAVRAYPLYEYKVGKFYVSKTFYGGISLGRYIIVNEHVSLIDVYHEHGHQIQSKRFGPLYLLIVGLPSITRNIWDTIFHQAWTPTDRIKWYYGAWPENNADKLGGVKR